MSTNYDVPKSSDCNAHYDYENREAFIPVLADYDISPKTGFLPEAAPLKRLPAQFAAWEALLDDYKRNISTAAFRESIDTKLPTLNVTRDSSMDTGVTRRAFLVLSFISSVYIWGRRSGDATMNALPRQLALPLCQVANLLGVCPITCYPGICLWNCSYDYSSASSAPGSTPLERIIINETFTGTADEQWFYAVPLAIELEGAKLLAQFSLGWNAATLIPYCNDADASLTSILCLIGDTILEMKKIFSRMSERCNPLVFYHTVRRFVTGWHGTAQGYVQYEIPGACVPDSWSESLIANPTSILENAYPKLQFSGASAGQSSMIQAIDVFLGITHDSTGSNNKTSDAVKVAYHHKMRSYMPALHRKYLNDCESMAPSIRDAAMKGSEDLRNAYKYAVSAMCRFRDHHLGVATRYIVKQQAPEKSTGPVMGTGGTDLVSFLNSMRQDTHDSLQIPLNSPSSEITSFGD